ncbi:NAD-dependent epimerase/dehydratase family protein [Amycolatopsis tolypomycina]|uniref:NAD-dependent epimerase/dehydratase family protein n=1 Tax=Amycolatopsis tolypomycina TaxID=208445 RepID=UPI0033B904C4
MRLKIAIAGGAGFVGINLAEVASASGHDVVLVDKGDRLGRYARSGMGSKVSLVEANLAAGDGDALAGADVIVNLAALAHVDYSMHFGEKVMANNICVQRTVLEVANRNRTPVLFTSSIEVYGGNSGPLFVEESPRAPLSPYGESKVFCEDLIQLYRQKYAVKATVVRLTNLYGPWQSPDRIIPRIIAQSYSNVESYVTTGRLRDFLYVADAVSAILGLVEAGLPEDYYNVSTGCGVKLEEVVDHIATRIPGSRYRTIDESDGGRGPSLVASAARLEKFLGWRPATGLGAGLEATLDWYGRNRDWWSQFSGVVHADRSGPEFLVDFAVPL